MQATSLAGMRHETQHRRGDGEFHGRGGAVERGALGRQRVIVTTPSDRSVIGFEMVAGALVTAVPDLSATVPYIGMLFTAVPNWLGESGKG